MKFLLSELDVEVLRGLVEHIILMAVLNDKFEFEANFRMPFQEEIVIFLDH